MTTRSGRRLVDDELTRSGALPRRPPRGREVDGDEHVIPVGDRSGADRFEAESPQVFLGETPDPAPKHAGGVAGVRRTQGRDADSMVALRPVVSEGLAYAFCGCMSCAVQVDPMPGDYTCPASMTAKLRAGVVWGKRVTRKWPSAFCSPPRRSPSSSRSSPLSQVSPTSVVRGRRRPGAPRAFHASQSRAAAAGHAIHESQREWARGSKSW